MLPLAGGEDGFFDYGGWGGRLFGDDLVLTEDVVPTYVDLAPVDAFLFCRK